MRKERVQPELVREVQEVHVLRLFSKAQVYKAMNIEQFEHDLYYLYKIASRSQNGNEYVSIDPIADFLVKVYGLKSRSELEQPLEMIFSRSLRGLNDYYLSLEVDMSWRGYASYNRMLRSNKIYLSDGRPVRIISMKTRKV